MIIFLLPVLLMSASYYRVITALWASTKVPPHSSSSYFSLSSSLSSSPSSFPSFLSFSFSSSLFLFLLPPLFLVLFLLLFPFLFLLLQTIMFFLRISLQSMSVLTHTSAGRGRAYYMDTRFNLKICDFLKITFLSLGGADNLTFTNMTVPPSKVG